jgi:dUTPase
MLESTHGGVTITQPVKFALTETRAYPPKVKYEHDAGMDFYNPWTVVLPPHSITLIDTGVKVEFPAGYVGLLKPKGGQNTLVGSGVIEWTYQGNIIFKLYNTEDVETTLLRGDAVGQMILVENLEFSLAEVEEEDIHQGATKRGTSAGIVLSGE